MGHLETKRPTHACWLVAAIAVAAAAAGCGEGDEAEPRSASSSGTSSAGGRESDGADAGSTRGLPAACPGGDEGGPVPATASELNAWLQTRAYECWARESAVHASTGPHGGNVRVYLNAALEASLARGDAEHPAGSVAVKELYGRGSDTVTGWAVGIKTQARSDGGGGWYWYEVFDTAPNASALEGQGKALCSNCHSGGRDFVLVPYPLR